MEQEVKINSYLVRAREIKRVEEKSSDFRSFTKQEMEILRGIGAEFVDLFGGETLETQIMARKPILLPNELKRNNILLKQPSLKVQVAIFPDPKEFCVPRRLEKKMWDLPAYEERARRDAKKLKDRTGIEDLGILIPSQASTFTELILRYHDQTAEKGNGVWLFGPSFGELNNASAITKNATDLSGSWIATVGPMHVEHGGIRIAIMTTTGTFAKVEIPRLMIARKK